MTDRPDPDPVAEQQTTPTVCYRHPDRPTALRCSRCGRPICGECVTPAPVGQLCPDDARQRVRVRGFQGVPSRLGHVHAYQTISSRRALSAMLKNQ